jgi:leucyl-tRNA synthetase
LWYYNISIGKNDNIYLYLVLKLLFLHALTLYYLKMADYNFKEIERKWQSYWDANQTYKTRIDHLKPKYYVLDMFPYPSGAGLHVGHPLGYIASDIVSRFKRLNGYNVLHPMGFDAFGLPAEQYAIQTGQHPAKTTDQNISRYKEQLLNIGFSYDWDTEVQTCAPDYYKWTQWIFLQLFESWYNQKEERAESIETLTQKLADEGNKNIKAACDEDTPLITAEDWNGYSEKEKAFFLLKYRLTYLAETTVNWCPALGTVLANDEVRDGLSVRGGHPVERKKMKQWSMRITAYADRLLEGLDRIDWTEALKEMQRNWIGKSFGCSVTFDVLDSDLKMTVFTTRVDTIFGVTFMTIAPEHEIVDQLTTPDQEEAVRDYIETAKNRSDRERMSDVKTVSGVFTGSYVIHPFSQEKIPIWIADYVLAAYGTGMVMGVPSSDTRDYAFASHFNIPIIPVQEGEHTDITSPDFDPKAGTMINSDFMNGLPVAEAIELATKRVEEKGIGEAQINFRLRDAVFGRQRYWGEPFPIYYINEIPTPLPEDELPLILPEVDAYLPTETGDPPLGRASEWKYNKKYPYELSTMPGWAGSSWYLFRYMDPKNEKEFVGKEAQEYWENVDLYIGGSEHATGHLMYSRFWTKFLYDRGFLSVDEPFKKLINQGMIQGRSNFVYRIKGTDQFVSYNLKDDYDVQALHVDVNIVDNDILDIEAFKKWSPDFKNATFILEDGKYICGNEVEKMSKSLYNVVNPDVIIENYGADTLRLYEMFLGPLEQSKPWNTHGIDGVSKFLRKFWRLFHDKNNQFNISGEKANEQELKILHKTIKKAIEDVDRYSFNTSVSNFMICVNELSSLKCNKREILEPLNIIISPYAPHITEELWSLMGHKDSIMNASYPEYNEMYIQEDSFEYPVSINGKLRTKINFNLDLPREEMERGILASEVVQKWLSGKEPKKIIIVPRKIINVVV